MLFLDFYYDIIAEIMTVMEFCPAATNSIWLSACLDLFQLTSMLFKEGKPTEGHFNSDLSLADDPTFNFFQSILLHD